MTRDEWKALSHSIRADARAFKEAHGGYPCFVRHFMHNGAEWTITRYRDFPKWRTYMRQTIIRRRPIASHIHSELDCAADFRRKIRHQPGLGKRGAKVSVKCAREWRLERDSGFYASPSAT